MERALVPTHLQLQQLAMRHCPGHLFPRFLRCTPVIQLGVNILMVLHCASAAPYRSIPTHLLLSLGFKHGAK